MTMPTPINDCTNIPEEHVLAYLAVLLEMPAWNALEAVGRVHGLREALERALTCAENSQKLNNECIKALAAQIVEMKKTIATLTTATGMRRKRTLRN